MFHDKENSDHRDIKQDDLFAAIDTQQNEREILRDVVWAVLSDQMALAMTAPDFVDVLADELLGTGVAAAIISDVKMLVGAQGSDKQAIEKRIRDVVIFQQNHLLQQQAQNLGADTEMSPQDHVSFAQVAQPVIAISPVIDKVHDIQETVINETSPEEVNLGEINLGEITLEEIDTEISVEEIITLENSAEEFQPVSVDKNDIDHAIAQKIDVALTGNQDSNDAAPDIVPVAIDSDTELEEDFIVNEDDCTIAVPVVQPVAFAADMVMSMGEAERNVNMAVAPLVQTVLSPAEIENGFVDPVVQSGNVNVADIQSSIAVIKMSSEHVVPTEIEQQPVVQTSVPSIPTFQIDKAAKEIVPIQNIVPEIVAEGFNEFSNKVSKEIITEDSLNISPVVVQADAVEQYVIVSDDVVSAAMPAVEIPEIVLPVSESIAEVKIDIPYHADERVEQETVAENPVQIQEQIQAQNIAMPQSHDASLPVQVQIPNSIQDPLQDSVQESVQELVHNHIQNDTPEIVAEGFNEFSNKISKEIITEDSLNISPVVVQADAVEQYVIVSDDVVSAAMPAVEIPEIVLPVSESIAEVKIDIPYHADERVEQEIVAENPVQIQEQIQAQIQAQNIAMPQSHDVLLPVQVQIPNSIQDPVQEHVQLQQQASSSDNAKVMPSVIIMNPVEEGKSTVLIQDNAKDVITAPDVFSLHTKEAPVTQQGDWYGDILNAQINSFYGSIVSYDAVADDEPQYPLNVQRPMKPIAV